MFTISKKQNKHSHSNSLLGIGKSSSNKKNMPPLITGIKISTSLYQQRGSASVMFILSFLLLFGLFTLGVEGARYLRTDSRLADATEIASLVIAATNKSVPISENLAEEIIAAYMPDETSVTSNVTRDVCDNDNCDIPGQVVSNGNNFVRYAVTAKTTHNSWFPETDNRPGFESEVAIENTAVALNLSIKADFIFALNFTNSISPASFPGRLEQATNIMQAFGEIIKKNNAGLTENLQRIAIVPFNERTRDKYPKKEVGYNTVFDRDEIILNSGEAFQHSGNEGAGKQSLSLNQVNYSETIAQILNDKNKSYSYPDYNHTARRFYTLPPTTDIDAYNAQLFSTFPDFVPGSNNTQHHQGLIRSAQIAMSEKFEQKHRFIILLTTAYGPIGPDSIFQKLISDYQLCDEIKDKLSEVKTSAGHPIKTTIALIKVGNHMEFGSQIGLIEHFKPCTSINILANNDAGDSILTGKQIYQQLMTEEVGHIYSGD
jgi:tight adherence protein G